MNESNLRPIAKSGEEVGGFMSLFHFRKKYLLIRSGNIGESVRTAFRPLCLHKVVTPADMEVAAVLLAF